MFPILRTFNKVSTERYLEQQLKFENEPLGNRRFTYLQLIRNFGTFIAGYARAACSV